jgi:hypothetical protein
MRLKILVCYIFLGTLFFNSVTKDRTQTFTHCLIQSFVSFRRVAPRLDASRNEARRHVIACGHDSLEVVHD